MKDGPWIAYDDVKEFIPKALGGTLDLTSGPLRHHIYMMLDSYLFDLAVNKAQTLYKEKPNETS